MNLTDEVDNKVVQKKQEVTQERGEGRRGRWTGCKLQHRSCRNLWTCPWENAMQNYTLNNTAELWDIWVWFTMLASYGRAMPSSVKHTLNVLLPNYNIYFSLGWRGFFLLCSCLEIFFPTPAPFPTLSFLFNVNITWNYCSTDEQPLIKSEEDLLH